MKYRTKLYISLVAIAFASIALALIIFSTESEKLVLKMLRSRSLSIAATAATQIDPDLIKKANQADSLEDPSFIKTRNQLIEILRANQRNDIYISDIYTLYTNPKNPGQLYIGVETDKTQDLPGTLYRWSDKDAILKSKEGYYVNPFFTSDQYGVWLSAFAPIRDSKGNYIGTLGVDINAADIHLQLQQLIKFALLGLSASLLLALVMAFFLSKQVTVSLDHLCKTVKEIGEGNFKAKAHLKTNDEFGELSLRINAMCKGLQERERLKMSFARYVSHHVLDNILATEAPFKLEGERRKITLLFSDIRQFTQLSEQLPPEEVVQLLNEYFEQMIEVIFSFRALSTNF